MPTAPQPLLPFINEKRELVADCRIFKVERVWRRSQRTGELHDFFNIAAGPWVNLVALTARDELVLVRQDRHGICDFTTELPAGMVEPGEDPGAAALRELREETGYAGTTVEPLGWVHPNPAIQNNRCYFYLARNVELVGTQQLDPREEIEVIVIPYAEVHDRIRRGDFTHSLTLAALFKYELLHRQR